MKRSETLPTPTPIAFMPPEIVGPYSPWPRKRSSGIRPRQVFGLTAATAMAGTFVHCAVPLIF